MKYVHTNLVAKNWRKLAQFYVEALACNVLPPERDLSGKWLTELTGIADVHIQGTHLQLPGYEEGGPTLEIFSYQPPCEREEEEPVNRQGFAHLAFHVDDVTACVEQIKQAGGAIIGTVIEKEFGERGKLTVAYCRDPEGNVVEVQNWNQ